MIGSVQAANSLLSVGVNFPDDTVGGTLAPADVAGAVPQANWNNGAAAGSGTLNNLIGDLGGNAVATGVSVSWSGSGNTWASTGRGEENNGFPAGGDRSLMTGYLDTSDTSTTTITFSGIPEPYASLGYDVLVYALGGVAGRGGIYTIGSTALSLTSAASPTAHILDPGVDLNDSGTYGQFQVSGTSFTLTATAVGGNVRAPINGIQIVERIPEPAAASLAAFAGLALLRRRR
ncbi:MAG: hypothetical protein ACKV19_07330 [Verrucomicrobiales bacterium]